MAAEQSVYVIQVLAHVPEGHIDKLMQRRPYFLESLFQCSDPRGRGEADPCWGRDREVPHRPGILDIPARMMRIECGQHTRWFVCQDAAGDDHTSARRVPYKRSRERR